MELKLKRLIKADQKSVYTAWLDAESIKGWHCGPPKKVISEAKVGGHLEIIFSEESCIIGKYKRLEPHSLISYTFKWGETGAETLVEIKFASVAPSQTEVSIHHSGFATQKEI